MTDRELREADDLDALVEVVDALCATLLKAGAADKIPDGATTLQSISLRASRLYRKRMGEQP